jgi:hypothetical protein
MREKKINRKGTIQAKEARVFWDTKEPKVLVIGDNGEYLKKMDYYYSGGACWAKWREVCKDKLKAKDLCLKLFFELVYVWELDPVIVHDALSVIIEYNEAAQPHDLDFLCEI